MFYYEILWLYQDFKHENLCFLNLYSVHAARILDPSLKILLSPKERRTLTTIKTFPSCQNRFDIFIF